MANAKDVAKTARETAAAAEVTAKAAAKILRAAANAASARPAGSDLQVAMTRMEGQITAMGVAIEAHNIASVERDTRIEEQVKATNGTVGKHTDQIGDFTLWRARIQTIWAGLVIAGPFVAGFIVWALNHYLP